MLCLLHELALISFILLFPNVVLPFLMGSHLWNKLIGKWLAQQVFGDETFSHSGAVYVVKLAVLRIC